MAAALASELGLPAGVLPVRKLGIPGHTEIAFGALAWSGGQSGQTGGQVVRILNRSLVTRLLALGLTQSSFDEVERRERAELERRAARYPDSTRNLGGKTVILADDGLATGASMRAAVEAVRGAGAARVVVAVPVASLTAQASLEPVTRSRLQPPHSRASSAPSEATTGCLSSWRTTTSCGCCPARPAR